jgi:succinate-semialdehyde dehydrogenase / glutarate-semialdehyde dehydrogenase
MAKELAMGITSINPATGEIQAQFTPLTEGEIDRALDLAQVAFNHYRQTSLAQRSAWLIRTAEILEEHRSDYARLLTLEMGKPLQSALAEVEKSALVCRFYAEHGAAWLADRPVATDARQSWIKYQPLGIILAVMPWNFPFWQVFRFAAPALMAGNVALLKHASNVPQAARTIAQIFRDAGLPQDVFQTLLIEAPQVARVIADDRVQAATLTGSEAAGKSLAENAGRALKKVVLELGGSDPFIVLATADVERAVAAAVTSRLLNNGQSCIAAKRFILAESIADAFILYMLEKFAALRVGDPMSLETDVGPLATPAILQELDRQVQVAIAQGAKALIGGKPIAGVGNFYAPTILSELSPTAAIAQEEFFGPVALVFRVPDVGAAIALANATPFGLGASAWTSDAAEQQQLIDQLEAGSVFINGMVKSDPRLPFGGIKRSGFGRELGQVGIYEFVNVKTVWVGD